MRKLVLMVGLVVVAFACMLAACGSETGTGVGGQEAEVHCRAWCDATTGCDTRYSNPADCLRTCRANLTFPCGEHISAYQDCVTALECNDRSHDCNVHYKAQDDCRIALVERCTECPEGTICYQSGCGDGCFYSGGDCNVTNVEGRCRYLVNAGGCTDYAGCVENNSFCPQEASP